MKWLCWDTSSKSGSIAALTWDPENPKLGPVLISDWLLNVEMSSHSERLLWAIDQVLKSADWKLNEVEAFGVGIGPGSFTGLRIGITTARTLAHTGSKPLIGISSLEALAKPAALWLAQSPSLKQTVLISATDACKGELFARCGKTQAFAKAKEEAIRPDDLIKKARKLLGSSKKVSWMVVGEGRNRYPEAWGALPKKQELQAPHPFPNQIQGRYLGMLLIEKYQQLKKKNLNPLEVFPNYVRAPDAELKLRAGLLKKMPEFKELPA